MSAAERRCGACGHVLDRKGSCASCSDLARAKVLELAPLRPSFPTLVDQIATLGGPRRKLATGIATLDTDTRGGLPLGTLVTLQGPPGSGKSGLACQWAERWSREGVPVRIVAADEGEDGWLIRLGQHNGISRDELEDGAPAARAHLAEAVTGLDLLIVDTDRHTATVEDVIATMSAPGVVIVDLVQTARVVGSDLADTPKARVDLMMTTLRGIANRDGHLVLALSEVNRGAYRSKSTKDHVNALAAGKESGSIESRSWAVYHLASVPNGGGAVDVEVAKGRFHREKVPFRLAFDRDRAIFTEVETPESAAPKTEDDKIADAKARVLRLLDARCDLRSASDVFKVLRGNRQLVLRAVREHLESGLVIRRNGYLATTVEHQEDAPDA